MSTPHRRPLSRRDLLDDEHQAVESGTAGARRLPIEAVVLEGLAAVADVHQEHAEPPRRRPLGTGPGA
ncbi:hypothetical protein [Kitasatospora sp. NPDC098663]|uniref:hypothetical protein n=1 Tax=Kitasatospora sp. NPDC098663 TaxID=3364096 RepID=UPI00381FA2BB